MENTVIISTPKRARLMGLPASAFQHPLDRQATENLKKIKGFDWLVKKVLEYGIERIEYVNHIGGAIRIGPRTNVETLCNVTRMLLYPRCA